MPEKNPWQTCTKIEEFQYDIYRYLNIYWEEISMKTEIFVGEQS